MDCNLKQDNQKGKSFLVNQNLEIYNLKIVHAISRKDMYIDTIKHQND